jgi:hypothetical protein
MKCAVIVLYVSSILIWPCDAHIAASPWMTTKEHVNTSEYNKLQQRGTRLESKDGRRNDEKEEYPLFTDLERCLHRFVCDPDSILANDENDALERELQNFSKRSYSQPSLHRFADASRGLPTWDAVSIQLRVILTQKVREIEPVFGH